MTFTHQKGNTYKDSIGEKFVSHIWESGHFVKSNLRTKDGRIIEVLHPGQWNNDAGADFTNAVIGIDDKIIKGDVEVHVQNSDWKIHHHDTDSRYNNTILHVVLWDGGTSLLTKKQNNERIPNLILSDYLEVSISKLLKAESNKSKHIQCPVNANPDIIDRAGIERLRIKSNAMNEQIASNGEDQALYEGIMDALGYSKNRKQFLDLAKKVPVNILLGQKLEKIQAMLFGTANLLPNIENRGKFDKETVEYLDIISPIWDEVKYQFHDKLMSTDEWRFFRLRPDNFPTRRMAGISFILSNCESEKSSLTARFLSILKNNDKSIKELSRKLRTILTPKAYGYWTNHYTFGSRKWTQSDSLIGNSRADDIIINVILPFTLAYSQRLSNESLSECAMRLWTGYGRLQDNTVTRYFSNRIFQSEKEYHSIINSASRQQGLIHIYKSFCSLHNCNNCPFI
jgi:hypothetical protein